MKALELRVPPLIVVPVTALAMWVVAQIVPSRAWPSNVRLAGAIALGAAGLVVAVAGVLAVELGQRPGCITMQVVDPVA